MLKFVTSTPMVVAVVQFQFRKENASCTVWSALYPALSTGISKVSSAGPQPPVIVPTPLKRSWYASSALSTVTRTVCSSYSISEIFSVVSPAVPVQFPPLPFWEPPAPFAFS